VRRDGRSMIYAARYDTMNALLGYLTENCCKGAADTCAPAAAGKSARSKRPKVPAS
jgi:ArsR family transcriptional regulator